MTRCLIIEKPRQVFFDYLFSLISPITELPFLM